MRNLRKNQRRNLFPGTDRRDINVTSSEQQRHDVLLKVKVHPEINVFLQTRSRKILTFWTYWRENIINLKVCLSTADILFSLNDVEMLLSDDTGGEKSMRHVKNGAFIVPTFSPMYPNIRDIKLQLYYTCSHLFVGVIIWDYQCCDGKISSFCHDELTFVFLPQNNRGRSDSK